MAEWQWLFGSMRLRTSRVGHATLTPVCFAACRSIDLSDPLELLGSIVLANRVGARVVPGFQPVHEPLMEDAAAAMRAQDASWCHRLLKSHARFHKSARAAAVAMSVVAIPAAGFCVDPSL